MKKRYPKPMKELALAFGAIVAGALSPSAFAASQTWSNAPSSSTWQTAANWVSNAVPGALNTTGNADIATFDSPLSAGIGGAANPIVNDLQRGIRSVRFETVGCGAYVFGSSLADNSLELVHLGDITISSAVTNPIVVSQGVRLRVPNSTNQRFDFTNNAANPNATLYFAVISNATANTRPWNVFLAGSNTGTNTIARIDDANGGAAGAAGAILMDKVGTGTWILSGANDLPQKTSAGSVARVQVIEGTLIVKDVASLGGITPGNLSVTNTGVLQIDGITPINLGMTLRDGGTIRMNGIGSINGLSVGTQPALNAHLRTTSSTDVFTVANAGVSVVSAGAADSTLNLNGPGTIVLSTANTYIGSWVIGSGTNQVSDFGALGTGPSVRVAAGAILDFRPLGATTYTLTTSGIGGSGTGTGVGSTAAAIIADPAGVVDLGARAINLVYTPSSFSGDTTRPALYVAQGTLSMNANGIIVNNNGGTPLGAGTYRLIQQASGNITMAGTAYAIVTGAGLGAGQVAEVQVSGGNVDLVVAPHAAVNLKWKGGNPDNKWDKAVTANFDNGVGFAQFGSGDNVTFDSLGTGIPTVDLVGTLLPASAGVDTSAGDYTFSGSGVIAGGTGLTKSGTGSLLLSTVNVYAGNTVVSNGTLRIGVSDAVSKAINGNVAIYGTSVLDLNGFNNTVNGLTGNGKVDVQNGGTSTLSVGYNGSSSTFTGLLANTSGTLGISKIGNGQFTLAGPHTYSGPTTIEAGAIEVRNPNALGSGFSQVTINAGSLLTATNVNINSLTGAVGTVIANTTGAGTTTITHTGNGSFTGVIGNGSAGTVRVYVPSGTLQLNGPNTYSGGTFVAGGAALAIGVINPGGTGTAGSGGISASNNATISLPTTVSTAAAPGNNITNAEAGGTITLSSASQGNSYGGLFVGGATSTNVFVGPGSLGGATPFANFSGTVVLSNASSWRWFNANGGGDSATFVVSSGAFMFSRDVNTIRLGALVGDGSITSPSVSAPATYLIGGKNLSTTYAGRISGSNNVVKTGTGSLTLNGRSYYTNSVTLPDSSIVDFTLFSNAVTYVNNTTVSNGTLSVVAPNNLTNSPNILLAGGTLDASAIGYWSNQTTLDFSSVEQPTNTVIVTTSTLDILANQAVYGFGSILGSVVLDAAATNNVGDSIAGTNIVRGIGTLTVSGSAVVNGTVNMDLNRTNSDRLTAASFSGSGATLNVNNLGATLRTGDTFKLFSSAIGVFAAVNLPTVDATGQIPYVWQNNLAVNGTITVLSGLSTNSPVLTNTTGPTTLTLNWPSTHLGWTLQAQTNSLSVGLGTNWFAVAGSTTNNSATVPIVKTNPTVFYRLNLPLP